MKLSTGHCHVNKQFAGPPCTPFSPMGLGEGEDDVVFKVHEKHYDVVGDIADMLVTENVPESQLQATLNRYLGADWATQTVNLDPRLFGLGCARARSYAISFKRSMFKLNETISVERVIGALMAQPVMEADDYFFLSKTPSIKLTEAEDT